MMPLMQPRREFSKLYCEHHDIDPSDYLLTLFKHALYPHARPLRWLLQWISPNYFRADYDFIHDVGRIRRFKDYELAVEEFICHPANRDNPLRTLLRIRVGSGRLRRIVRATMSQPAPGSPPVAVEATECTTQNSHA
jgi:hypothetical protein